MDPIESIFNAMHVESALYARLEAQSPWGVSFDVSPAARFAIVVRGSCWLSGPGLEQPISMTGGDCFIVKGEASFLLQDELSSSSIKCTELFANVDGKTISFGGEGALTEIVAGRFDFDTEGGAPLMSLLPSILHIRMDQERARLLQATLHLLAMEISEQSIGSGLVVNRLADILFIQAVRAYCTTEGKEETGWLAALSDRQLGPLMSVLHADLSRGWTVESMAFEAGMSRSAFAYHFKNVVKNTPLGYLTQWRMYQAKTLLRQDDLSLSKIAQSIGYGTDAAFNRVFKNLQGISPGEYRRLIRTGSMPDLGSVADYELANP